MEGEETKTVKEDGVKTGAEVREVPPVEERPKRRGQWLYIINCTR